MKLYAAVDLHSNNNYLGIIDQKDKRVHKKKLPNKLSAVLRELEPYRDNLEGVVVESTFNWYWLDTAHQAHKSKAHKSSGKNYAVMLT